MSSHLPQLVARDHAALNVEAHRQRDGGKTRPDELALGLAGENVMGRPPRRTRAARALPCPNAISAGLEDDIAEHADHLALTFSAAGSSSVGGAGSAAT